MDKELVVVRGKVIEQQRTYSPDSGKQISLEHGAKMVKNHFEQNPDDAIAHFMGKNQVEAILSQEGCVGLRIYQGVNELGVNTVIFAGVDKAGNNILASNSGGKDIIMGGTKVCPPYCPDKPGTDSGW